MGKKKITFNEDHIKLISAFRFGKINNIVKMEVLDNDAEVSKSYGNRFTLTKYPVDSEGEVIHDKITDIRIKVNSETNDGESVYGINTYQLYQGTYLYEDMALILGKTDHVIPESLESPLGAIYDEETMTYFYELDEFITTHIQDIFEILLQFCGEGIQAGVEYWCYDYDRIWRKKEEKY